MRLIYSTFDTYDKAHAVGCNLVEEKLAACVNIIENKASIYSWQGKIITEKEYVLLVKTKDDLTRPASELIKQKHPYTVPCILSIACKTNTEYSRWVDEVTL